jgi:hypothetical protein
MARWSVLVGALVATVLLAPPAQAKGPIELCGASGCAPLSDNPLGVAWTAGSYRGSDRAAPAAPGPYYVIRFADVPSVLAYWVPGAGLLRVGDKAPSWVRAKADDLPLLTDTAAGLRAYPAPREARAAVDGKPARGGSTYLRLYTAGTQVSSGRSPSGWLGIWIMGRQTPWTDGRNSLWISRRGTLLRRDRQLVRIAPALADRIRARAPLTS